MIIGFEGFDKSVFLSIRGKVIADSEAAQRLAGLFRRLADDLTSGAILEDMRAAADAGSFDIASIPSAQA